MVLVVLVSGGDLCNYPARFRLVDMVDAIVKIDAIFDGYELELVCVPVFEN